LSADDLKLVLVDYKKIEAIFLVTLLEFLLVPSTFLLGFAQMRLREHNIPFFSFVYFESMFSAFFYWLIHFLALWCPLVVSFCVFLTMSIGKAIWRRFCRKQLLAYRKLAGNSYQLRKNKDFLLQEFLNGRKLFVDYLISIMRDNKNVCMTVFSRSIDLTIAANVVFINKLLIVELNIQLRIIVIMILVFQLIVIVTDIYFKIVWFDQLYRPSKVFAGFSAKVAQHSANRDVLKLLRLS